ncbi:MAG: lipase maturation factor family protein, partial [Actinobacteria bacterium]|nr:lipase maturation factor family protein [Actinomycetota bacterium]
TQPMPSLFSWHFHHLPRWAHRVETGANHVVQLVLPFGLFLPQPVAGVAATAIIVTQGWLVISGNFAWLNAITIVLATSALPDAWLDRLPALETAPGLAAPETWLVVLAGVAFLATAWESRKPVRNMLSPAQAMNASFNPFHLVGTYGAFGSVTKTRYEVVLEGTDDPRPDPDSDWREYHFRAKPTDVRRRPPQFAPYHLRLDWLMWFLAMSPSPGRHGRWFSGLVGALLAADPAVLGLLRDDPFGGDAPTAVRARRYRYRYTTRAERRETGAWWDRELVGEFLPPVGRRP